MILSLLGWLHHEKSVSNFNDGHGESVARFIGSRECSAEGQGYSNNPKVRHNNSTLKDFKGISTISYRLAYFFFNPSRLLQLIWSDQDSKSSSFIKKKK